MTDLTKIIVAAVVVLTMACSRSDSGASSGIDLSPFQSQRDLLCGAFDPSTIERCDRSTFHILMSSSCGQPLPTQYEQPEGKWNRDVESCYPEDSRSETSRDAYLSTLLSQDKAAISRALQWAERNGGDTGLPAGGVGNVSDLMPLMRRSVHLTGEADSTADEGLEAIQKAFSGHRGHLIAGWLWARARIYGGLTVGGAALLRKLHDETPESPYLSCLYHRFSRLDNDQSGTVKLLKRMPHEDNTFGWGSSVWQLHYVLTVSCLSGE
jgi:hypothetical protein